MKLTNDRSEAIPGGWRNDLRRAALLASTTLLLVFFVLPGLSQEQSSTSVEGKQGQVTGSDVRLRGGPGKNYKPIGTIEQGTQLQVQGKEREWLKVVPPAQAQVWIYGKYVKKTGSDSGTVSGTSVNVRPLPRADRTNKPVGQVSEPLEVSIRDSRKKQDEEHPWYLIRMPEKLSAWIHSDYVRVSAGSDEENNGDESKTGNQEDEPVEQDGTAGSSPDTPPQKGGGKPPQKGGEQNGEPPAGQESTKDGTGTQGAQQNESQGESSEGSSNKWVQRLESIQKQVEEKRRQKDKLKWDFSDQIQQLETYEQQTPIERLRKQARNLRERLQEIQSSVREERKQLNKRLKEIQQERKSRVKNTITNVLKAKGFNWEAVGQVRSVGNLYYETPAEYELVKGGERVYFLTSGRDILKLRNYRGLQVAVAGQKRELNISRWDAPVLEVTKIEAVQ